MLYSFFYQVSQIEANFFWQYLRTDVSLKIHIVDTLGVPDASLQMFMDSNGFNQKLCYVKSQEPLETFNYAHRCFQDYCLLLLFTLLLLYKTFKRPHFWLYLTPTGLSRYPKSWGFQNKLALTKTLTKSVSNLLCLLKINSYTKRLYHFNNFSIWFWDACVFFYSQ